MAAHQKLAVLQTWVEAEPGAVGVGLAELQALELILGHLVVQVKAVSVQLKTQDYITMLPD